VKQSRTLIGLSRGFKYTFLIKTVKFAILGYSRMILLWSGRTILPGNWFQCNITFPNLYSFLLNIQYHH